MRLILSIGTHSRRKPTSVIFMLGSKNGRGGATRTPRPLRPERSALATALHPDV